VRKERRDAALIDADALSVDEVASRLRCSAKSVRRYITDGYLKVTELHVSGVGFVKCVRRADLDALITKMISDGQRRAEVARAAQVFTKTKKETKA